MSPKFRCLLALCAAVSIVALGSGCGKKNPKPPPIQVLTQEQSDDLVQQVAMMVSTVHGGWLVDLQSTLLSIPLLAPPGPQAALARRLHLFPTATRPGFGIDRDTTFMVASMSDTFFYYYTDSSGDSLSAWADSVVQVDGVGRATGTITSDTTFSGFYHHVDDPISATGIEAGSDTVYFTGVCDDSLFTTFRAVFRGETRYFATSGFVDYQAYLLRNGSNLWPVSGQASAFLFGDVLRTPNPTDISTTLEATVVINFDGTQTPTVDVINELESLNPKFHYRMNLRTGAIQRLP